MEKEIVETKYRGKLSDEELARKERKEKCVAERRLRLLRISERYNLNKLQKEEEKKRDHLKAIPEKMETNYGQPRAESLDEKEKAKARVSNPIEGERSCVYFLVRKETKLGRSVSTDRFLYTIDFNAKELCARKLSNAHLPSESEFATVGSCGTLIYFLGGYVWGPSRFTSYDVSYPQQKTYFYDTADPEKGWFMGPPMCSPRHAPPHQVIGNRIYVMDGVECSYDVIFEEKKPCFPWGEYLDVSEDPQRWQWVPMDVSLGRSGAWPDDDYYSLFWSLPAFKEKFVPQRHIVAQLGNTTQYPVCFDVRCKLLFRASDALKHYEHPPVFFDGDWMFLTDSSNVLARRVFRDGIMVDGGSECTVDIGVEGMTETSSRLPVRPHDSFNFQFEPYAFRLVQLAAPHRYATLWCPRTNNKEEEESKSKSCVRLSVFTVSPDSCPLVCEIDGLPLMRATVEVSDEHLVLDDFGEVSIEAAVVAM